MKLIERGTNIKQIAYSSVGNFEFFFYEECLCMKVDGGNYLNLTTKEDEHIGYLSTNVGEIDQDSVSISYKVERF